MLIIEIALGIVLAIIILANIEAIFAIGLWVIGIAIIAAIAIALLVFTFNSVADSINSVADSIFVTSLIVFVYIIYRYTTKGEARETYLKDNRVPEILLDLVKSNLGAKDLAADYKKEIKFDGFIIEFKQVTKNGKTGFLITVIKTINNNKRSFICALHTEDCKPSSFIPPFVTSSTLVYGVINTRTSILLTVSTFCEMKYLLELVTELNNVPPVLV